MSDSVGNLSFFNLEKTKTPSIATSKEPPLGGFGFPITFASDLIDLIIFDTLSNSG